MDIITEITSVIRYTIAAKSNIINSNVLPNTGVQTHTHE